METAPRRPRRAARYHARPRSSGTPITLRHDPAESDAPAERFPEALVTVAIIARDAAAHLEPTLASLRAQRFDDFNVVLLDDGSTDATAALAERCAADWPRLRVLRQLPRGIPASRNRILDGARCRYLAILDADDLALPERLATQVAFLERHPDCALCASGYEVFASESPAQVLNRRAERLDQRRLATRLAFRNPVLHSSVMLRVAALRTLGLRYDERYACAEDYELLTRTALVARIDMLPEVLVRYRRHPAQSIARLPDALREHHLHAMARLWRDCGVEPSPADLAALAFPKQSARAAALPRLLAHVGQLRAGLAARDLLDAPELRRYARHLALDALRPRRR